MATAEIISIGDEILIGQIVNNNAAWMAQQLNLIGVSVRQITTVGDNKEELLRIFSEARERANIILITGGLGPTSDDITKPVLCEFFNTKLVFNEKCFEDVKFQFESRKMTMPAINRGQAEIPENCIPIRNKNGTAPGMWFTSPLTHLSHERWEVNAHVWVSLPGVPYEMKAMMNEFVIPELKKKFTGQAIVHKTVYTQGMGESSLAEKIKEWEESLSGAAIKLAYLPSPGQVKLRLSAKGENEQELAGRIDEKIDSLKKIIPELIFAIEEFGKEPETLEKTIGELLRKKNKTIAVAESCTGGYISHLITSISGSSDYFKGSVIAYSNEVKIKELDVKLKTLSDNGAVSKEVAVQMAEGVRKNLNADIGISTTGIAGPAGGSREKPVGTVFIAICQKNKTICDKFLFGNDRERNIRRAALTTLSLLRKLLETR
ncbi:MAG TPA: competence/damage-inducible protein A [Bacteroidia bacterium]